MTSYAETKEIQWPSITQTQLLIDGRFVDGAEGRTFATIDPSTGRKITDVAEATAEDVDRAVQAAWRAMRGAWGESTPAQRGRLLWRLADLVEEHLEELAKLEALDVGKPWRQALEVDLPIVVDHLRYYAGWPSKIEGSVKSVSTPGVLNYTRREPVGVVGQIIPWNFPLMMVAWKIGAALACGNAVVLKPAEQTPLSALRMGELILEAGFPSGVVNIVPGFGEIAGRAIVDHQDVRKVAFTGSTEVGREIVQRSAGNLKRVSLELGGKGPNIILSDADLERALDGALLAMFLNQGESCAAGSRLLLERPIYDEFLNRFVEAAKRLRLGPGLADDSQIGPMISHEHRERVERYIRLGREEGAVLLTGGGRPAGLDDGYFVETTVFTSERDDLTICREEIFGPVTVVLSFDSLEEAARVANNSRYGLAAGVWTRDLAKAHRLAHMLESGTVWVNTYYGADAATPWGGFKESGWGREMGSEALEMYTEVKSVWVSLA